MAYADDERSTRDGDPRELVEFLGPQIAYRYSLGDEIVHEGHVYSPLPISLSPVGVSGTVDPPALDVRLPVSANVVTDYGFGSPPRTLRLRVHRRQTRSAEWRVIWDGVVVGVKPSGRWAVVRSESQVGRRLSTTLPSVTVQRHCNHFLYDRHCRVDRLTYDFTALVTNVNGASVTLNSIGIAPDQWFRAGEIVRDVDGERRAIVDQVGAVLKLSSPFNHLANGDGVTLYAGCDHTVGTCSDRFNNLVNFGGHPSVPSSNPWHLPILLTRDLT